MFVSSSTLRLALCRILDEWVAAPGAVLRYTDLELAWLHTGLRTSDLRDAVRELVERGEMLTTHQGDALAFTLTAVGCQSLAAVGKNGKPPRVRDALTLLRARYRKREAVPAAYHRRADDHAARASDDD